MATARTTVSTNPFLSADQLALNWFEASKIRQPWFVSFFINLLHHSHYAWCISILFQLYGLDYFPYIEKWFNWEISILFQYNTINYQKYLKSSFLWDPGIFKNPHSFSIFFLLKIPRYFQKSPCFQKYKNVIYYQLVLWEILQKSSFPLLDPGKISHGFPYSHPQIDGKVNLMVIYFSIYLGMTISEIPQVRSPGASTHGIFLQAGYRWFQLANRADSRRGQVMSQKRAQERKTTYGTNVWEMYGKYLVNVWKMLEKLGNVWKMSGKCWKSWEMYGKYLVNVGKVGKCMENIW